MIDSRPMAAPATIMDGTATAGRRLSALKKRVASYDLTLGIILATDNPATAKYVAAKERQGAEAGIAVYVRRLSADSSEEAIIAVCQELNQDEQIDAYIVQLPLPDGVNPDHALAAVDPTKDADGLSPANLARLYAGDPAVVPATPRGILTLLEAYDISVAGRIITVVGQGRLTGKPLAALLETRGATVIRCDKSTADLAAETRKGEIVVVAAGQPGLITAEMVRDRAVVIDVGVTKLETGTVGDVDYAGVSQKARAITPVPGGVGPMTVVSLLENVAELAEQRSAG